MYNTPQSSSTGFSALFAKKAGYKMKLILGLLIGLPLLASVISVPDSALIPSTALYTDEIGGGIGTVVVMTGPPGDPSVGDPSGRSNDAFSGPIPLGFTLSFFGNTYSQFFINSDGSITFTKGLFQFTPTSPQGAALPIISPFFADVDTTNPASGVIYLRMDIPNEVIVTWDQVGYFAGNVDKLDTFQLVLRGPGYNVPAAEGQVGFFYGAVQWEVGDASGGVDGFCPQGLGPPDCVPAAVGFGDGNSNGQVLDGSTANGISSLVNDAHIWFDLNAAPVPVPEPASTGLFLLGIGAIAWKFQALRRVRDKRTQRSQRAVVKNVGLACLKRF